MNVMRLLLGALLFLGCSRPPAEPDAPAEPSNTTAPQIVEPVPSDGTLELSTAKEDSRVSLSPQFVVAGWVVDQNGTGIRSRVFVGNTTCPFSTGKGRPEATHEHEGRELFGRVFQTENDGTFQVTVKDDASVFCIAKRAYYDFSADLYSQDSLQVRPKRSLPGAISAAGFELLLNKQPSATVQVSLVDPQTEREQSNFRVRCTTDGGGSGTVRCLDTKLNLIVPATRKKGSYFSVELHSPELQEGRIRKLETSVFAGKSYDLVLGSRDSGLKGTVVTTRGRPIPRAAVFASSEFGGWGEAVFARITKRNAACVETGKEGQFTLYGTAEFLTVFHPEYATTTVPVDARESIVLQPRSALKLLCGSLESPFPNTPPWVTFDGKTGHKHKHSFSPSGTIELQELEPGAHQVRTFTGDTFLIRLQPGRTTVLDVSTLPEPVCLEWRSGAEAYVDNVAGVAFGMGETSRMKSFGGTPSQLSISGSNERFRVLKKNGVSFEFPTHSSSHGIKLGDCFLEVHSEALFKVYLLPEEWQGDTISLRLAAGHARTVYPQRDLVFGPLRRGRYVLIDQEGTVVERCRIDSKEQSVTLSR